MNDDGTCRASRPTCCSSAAIMAGLLPILWSTGAGSEVMQRIAVPMMVGGMISSTLLASLRHGIIALSWPGGPCPVLIEATSPNGMAMPSIAFTSLDWRSPAARRTRA
jgi:hypothetical protein